MIKKRTIGIFILAIMVITFGAIPVSYVHASGTTFTVNSTLDTPDNSPGDGICDDGSGNCTLRAAIEEANVVVSGAVIINFNVAGENIAKQTITLGSSLPSITKDDVTIDASTDQSVNGGSSDGTTCGDLWGVGGSHIDPVWKILITGAGAPVSYVGLSIGSSTSNTVIRGLEMTGFYNGSQGSNPALDVDGTNATVVCNYFTVNGKNVRVHGSGHMIGGPNAGDGNVFNGNQQNEALPLLNTTNVTVQGNFFGTNPSGTATSINAVGVASERGINLESAIGTHVGGTVFGQGNLFSGNTDGINLTSSPDSLTTPTSNTIIEGNYFGTDVTGTVALGNTDTGISVKFATNTLIGGTTTGSRNVIAGTTTGFTSGISIRENATTTTVKGNYIGTDKTGNSPLGSYFGVMFQDGAQDNIVGGITVADRNIISGNGVGVQFLAMDGGIISRNTVLGNYIGVGADGTTSVPNTNYGISLVGQTVANNVIGGTTAGSGNIIANNTHAGISTYDFSSMVFGPAGTGNAFLGNSIFANGDLGISLTTVLSPTADPATPTLNDTLDPDTGPNNLQNFPVLTSATTDGTNTTVIGTLNSLASTSYRIEFFSNTAADASGYGEGQTYIGYTTVTTDGSGNASFTATGLDNTSVGAIITATASQDIGGGYYSTSEFSAPPASPVTSVATTHTLTYTAGSHGSLTGTTTQTVNDGSDGTAVTAVPESGYQFSSWSDGSTANPRTDTNVTVDISVTANFITISSSGTSNSGSISSGVLYGCHDAKAINYDAFTRNDPSLCKYESNPIPVEQIINSGTCPSNLIVHNFMRRGDKDGNYDSYNQGTVTEIKLLQTHINRILASEYAQAAGPIDGIFGILTKQGVERLQIALNQTLKPTPLLKIDGIVGPFTREAINHSCGGM